MWGHKEEEVLDYTYSSEAFETSLFSEGRYLAYVFEIPNAVLLVAVAARSSEWGNGDTER